VRDTVIKLGGGEKVTVRSAVQQGPIELVIEKVEGPVRTFVILHLNPDKRATLIDALNRH
jgi:hypothetical protein